ncbi:MAG: acyl--CoA ligase, partial [Desulfatitalea sp.]|nr:long-chain fatty acid--CoA ligase [Desulfatitalea sp.]NNJ99828.1 acyl--CoA ligase [Desulfatitalea sp.]
MWYNLGETVRYWAKYYPNDIALWVEGESFTWTAFNERTDELAAGLEKIGIRLRDRVAILSDNCVEWCETVIAVLKIGGIIVPLNPRLLARELEYLVENSGTRLIICDEAHRERANEVKANLADVVVAQIGTPTFESLRVNGAKPAPVVLGADTPAAIGYTSGTTGFPKGATLSHEGIRCMGLGTAMMNGFNAATRTLTPVP